jgi:hypothetical protein
MGLNIMADSNNEEVKEFVQTVAVTPSLEDETVDNEEETETPPSSSDGEKEPEAEEAEVEEETPEAEEDTAPVAEAPKTEPKPVAGETPREKALRLEATRLKGLLREQKREELFVKQPTDISKKDEDLAGYDPEEVERFEKLIGKLGYAKKDDIISQTSSERLNDTFNEFMEAHPEYAPENDKDGLLWNQYKSEFALYNPSKDPKVLKKILNKVHNEVYGVQPAKNLSKINASQEKIKVASHTGASAGKETRRTSQAPSGLRMDMMKGFDPKEIEELLG